MRQIPGEMFSAPWHPEVPPVYDKAHREVSSTLSASTRIDARSVAHRQP
jgi:NADH:ubiquinone oxidoreductase subunit 2 (subunit N)